MQNLNKIRQLKKIVERVTNKRAPAVIKKRKLNEVSSSTNGLLSLLVSSSGFISSESLNAKPQ